MKDLKKNHFMKILSAAQLSEADKYTIKKQNITSEDLMERAGIAVFNEIHKRLQGAPIPIKIFCGIGNNGGDGLVVARHLIQHGYHVDTYIVNYTDKRTDDFLSNYTKLKDATNDWPELIKSPNGFPEIHTGDFVIDAIFGIGLNRPIEGWMVELVKMINSSQAFTLSIDMPSGMYADKGIDKDAVIIEADYTLSFQAPKMPFFLPETMDYVGELQLLDIGLDREFLANTDSETYLIGKDEAASLYRSRKQNSHKGDYGKVLIVGGSYGKIGSVLLSAKAALRMGTGLCSLYIPECGYNILQTGLPEAMVLTDKNEKILSDYPEGFDADVVAFGMGAGTEQQTVDGFKKLLQDMNAPILVDADGLNILSENKELLKLLPENSVLTPHPGELKRLIGEWTDDFDKLDKAVTFSKEFKIILVIKGAHTFIINQGETFINTSGNPGMATAGSGDVLSGIITSLIGQKYNTVAAAVMGVYLHGLSGDIAAAELGYESVMASDIADNLGKAVKSLFQKNRSEASKN